MSGGWSKQHDFIRLADARTELEYSIPVGELPGVGVSVAAASEPLQTRLTFGREQGLPAVDVEVRGAVQLQCQRCMRSFELPLDLQSRVVLLLTEQQADRAPPSLETYLAADGRVSAAALVAEEVLLAVPLVPRHEDEAQCAVQADAAAVVPAGEAAGSAGTRRPFADLQSLLQKGRV